MTEHITSAPVVSTWRHPASLWRGLIEPAAAIREPERRRRARLLSALLVVTLLLAMAAVILTWLGPGSTLMSNRVTVIWITLVAMMILAGAYALSRTHYSALAAVLTVVVILFVTFTDAVIEPGEELLLVFPMLAGLVSGLFLSPRTTGLVFLVTLIIMVALPIIVPGYPVSNITNALFLILTAGAIVVVGATMHRLDKDQIEMQSRVLAEREAHLQDAVQTARQANEELAGWVEELEQRTAEITLLSRMAEMLQTCQKADEAHAVIGRFAPRLFPATIGGVYLIGASGNDVQAAVAWGDAPMHLGECPFALSGCWALWNGHMHLMQDKTSEFPCQHVEAGRRTALPSVCVPMTAQGEALGVLRLEVDAVPDAGE